MFEFPRKIRRAGIVQDNALVLRHDLVVDIIFGAYDLKYCF